MSDDQFSFSGDLTRKEIFYYSSSGPPPNHQETVHAFSLQAARHCHRGCLRTISARGFAQNLSSVSIITASHEAGGINPDYSLPVASFPEASLAGHAELPVNGPYNDTFFHSNGSIFGKGTSFPSGHAMMAFSVATVFARRYHDHRWVPYVAYAVAGAIVVSRVTTGAHFPADVFSARR